MVSSALASVRNITVAETSASTVCLWYRGQKKHRSANGCSGTRGAMRSVRRAAAAVALAAGATTGASVWLATGAVESARDVVGHNFVSVDANRLGAAALPARRHGIVALAATGTSALDSIDISVPEGGYSDGSWAPEGGVMSDMLRMMPGSALEDRKVLKLGEAVLRRKSKMVKKERVSNENSTRVAGELVRVLRGPDLPGRTRRGGSLVAPQLGTPSRLICVEDPEGEINELSAEQRAIEGRDKPFGPKVIFNPRLKPVAGDSRTSVGWERNPSVPGYRALVERPMAVQVEGLDPTGREVKYVAKGYEARLVQQAVDALDGVLFVDRCLMRSLRHLDSRDDPLPPDLPPVGIVGENQGIQLSEADLINKAESGGGKGFLAGIPGIGRPNVFLAGSLILRLRSPEVAVEDVVSGTSLVQDTARELKEALQSGKHPLGISAPQMGRRVRAIAVGETETYVNEKLSARQRVTEEHRAFGPLVLFNPVVTKREGSADAFFFERTPTVPGYEAVVGRALEVSVEALSEKGEAVSFVASGWQARMIQHTVDVLDGTLYVDIMERRSFRRDNIQEPLPEDVPYGVRPAKRAAPVTSAAGMRPKAAVRSGGKRSAGSTARSPKSVSQKRKR